MQTDGYREHRVHKEKKPYVAFGFQFILQMMTVRVGNAMISL